jgi:polyphenol oxidase
MKPSLAFITAPNLRVPHGFSTRAGGVSTGPYAALNLGLSTGDDRTCVEENRRRFAAAFGLGLERACALSQVHSDRVILAEPSLCIHEADAAVTDEEDLLLVVSAADCLPLLFFDPSKGAIGAAHCGWRGSLAGLAAKVVAEMVRRYGSSPESVRVALGPGIRGPCYQVGAEVAEAFTARGFEHALGPDDEGRYLLDLALVNRLVLTLAGVSEAHIWDSGLCTHCDASRFYSHRRDLGKTGRHWAGIRL